MNIYMYIYTYIKGFSDGSGSNESSYNAEDLRLITGSGRSPPPALWRPLSVGPNRQEVSWQGGVWLAKSQPKKWGREKITGYPCRHVSQVMLSWQSKISNRIKVYFLPFSLPSAGQQGALFITASQGPCLWKFPQPSVQRESYMDHTFAVNASALKYYMSLLEPCFVGRSRSHQFSSVQSSSSVMSNSVFATPWIARQASLSITNSWSPPKPMSIELVTPSNDLILCHPLLLLPSIFPSIRVFSNE